MKNIFLFASSALFTLFIHQSFSQSTIWSEDFNSYSDNSGYIGSAGGAVTTGDYPGSITKWTLNVSGGTLSANTDWFMVNSVSGNNLFEARDTDGPCVWLSESIDISNYLDVSFELLATESGNLETTDYLDVEYRIGSGSWTLIADWNGEGSATHTLINDYTSQIPTVTNITGSALQLRVTISTDHAGQAEYLRFDDILVEGTLPPPPTAEFSANITTVLTSDVVSFTDESLDMPTAWDWSFSPETVTYVSGNSLSQNPHVQFNAPGLYTVSLIATNAYGSDTETKIDYISAFDVFPPSNDNCANAIPVGEVTNYPFSIEYATQSGVNPGCGGAVDPVDIWFAYTPASNGIVSIDLCGSNYDTRLAVWDACGGNLLFCNDDDEFCSIGSNKSYVSGIVVEGNTYYVQVGGYDNFTGDGFLTIGLEATTPANNNCASAIPINEVYDLPFSTLNATASGQNPGCGGTAPIDIWYTYTPAQSGIVSIDLCGSEFNTRLAVWDACGGSVIWCNDNSWGFCGLFTQTSYVSGPVTAGTIYYIQVGGNNAETGLGDLTLTMVPYPTNDECANAIAIGEVTDLPFTTNGASAGGDTPDCGGVAPVDIWYTYTPAQSGIVNVDLCGSLYNTRLAVWDACGGNLLLCNDDDTYCGFFSNTSFLSGPVNAGTVYYIQVGGNGTDVGVGDITLSFYPYPTNDECTTALAIGEVTDLPYTTVGATAGANNPGCGGSQPVDIWFAYTPSQTGEVAIDLCGSNYDTRLAVWDACGGTVLACNDNDAYCGFFSQTSYLTLAVASGITYYIQVGGADGDVGTGDLTLSFFPYPANDECSNAIAIGEVTDLPFSTTGATAGGDNPGCGGAQPPVDIWYAYTASGNGLAMFDLCGSNFNTRLAIWDNCNGTALICNDNDNYCGFLSQSSYIEYNVTAGTTYFIQVGGNNNATGNGDLTIYLDVPSNDALWTGIVSNDWSVPNNWQSGYIPVATKNVTIPTYPAGGNYPELNTGAGAVVNDLVIQPGSRVYIPSNNSLTVNGSLGNGAGVNGLVIKSDNTGTGSLKHKTDGVNATVEQLLTDDKWHYISSPITNALSNVFLGIYLKPFIESTYSWGDYITATNVNLNVMQGYSSWTYEPAIVSFQGPLNNGPKSIGVTAQYPGPANIGFNLVGNPYPSALDWDAPGWDKTNIDNTIYFYEGNGLGGYGNYRYYVGAGGTIPGIGTEVSSGIIPPMQGFFVKASANSTLSVSNSARVHSSQAFYKESPSNELPVLRLVTEDVNGLNDETIIRFYEAATHEHDSDYDAFKLFGWMVPQLYSITPEQSEIAINTLPSYENGMIVPLGLQPQEEGIYSLALAQFENFETGTDIYLEDLLTGDIQKISDMSTYSFISDPDQEPNRFLLHFEKDMVDANAASGPNINIYAFDKRVYIHLPQNADQAIVNIFNMMGQNVQSQNISGQNVNHIGVRSPSGFYLITVQTSDQYYSKKVFIK
jgi:PKD repeat protein